MQVRDIQVDQDKRELTVQAEAAFPLAVYHSVMSRNLLGYTRLHWHRELQFCLVTAGKIRFFVKDAQFLLQEGEGIFINSGLLHMARPVGNPDSSYICLDIGPRLLSGFPGSVMEQRYVLPLQTDAGFSSLTFRPESAWERELLQKIQEIHALREEEREGWQLEVMSRLYRLLSLLLQHRPAEEKPRRSSQANASVQKILAHIAAHYAEALTLSEIAAVTAYTESECCRIFRRYTGESIFSYLRGYRLEQSIGLLTGTEQSVSEIAYACGFRSTSYYIEAFRKQLGMTPLRYRKTRQAGKEQQRSKIRQGLSVWA